MCRSQEKQKLAHDFSGRITLNTAARYEQQECQGTKRLLFRVLYKCQIITLWPKYYSNWICEIPSQHCQKWTLALHE